MEADPKDAAQFMRPCDPGLIEAYPVDRRVGNVRNDDPDLAEPIVLDAPAEAATEPKQGSLF
jgi:putative SOS response-associated peptidase YedK